MSEILDSGNRREFESGAVRDIQEGKGRCDLLPLVVLGKIYNDGFLFAVGSYIESKDPEWLQKAFDHFKTAAFGSVETALLELAKHYEDGCRKYGERNWEKGIPVHCFLDSAVRHYIKFSRGDKDERHDRAVLWNIVGAMWTIQNKPECNDIGGGVNERVSQ